MNKLIEHNENLETPLYLPSHLEILKEKHEYFEVLDLESKVERHDNPHYWLQQDTLQIKQFQDRFFQNIILTEDTIPQIKKVFQFLLKFLRYNYQLLWEQQDQNSYIIFPRVLTGVELLPFIITNRNKHSLYRDPTSYSTHYFELITFDSNFIIEKSETSDNRLYTTSNIFSETSFEEYDQDVSQTNRENNTQIIRNQVPQQPNLAQNQQQDINSIHNLPDTVQNVSELSDTTTQLSTKFYNN